jgi:hypothetical protein
MDFHLKGNIIKVVTHTNHEYLARITNCIHGIVYVDAYIYQDELRVFRTSTVLCSCEDIKTTEDANDQQIAYFQLLLLEKHIIYNIVNLKCYDLSKFPPYFYDKTTDSAVITGNTIYGYTDFVNLTDNTILNAPDYGYINFDELIPAKKDTQVYNYIQRKIMDIKANIKLKNNELPVVHYKLKHIDDDFILNYDVNVEDKRPLDDPYEEVVKKLKNLWDNPIKIFKLGDIIYVRNDEDEEWCKKFFACFDKTSIGESRVKTTDGKFWKLYKN